MRSNGLRSESTPIEDVEAQLTTLADALDAKEYFNEPGICLGMDYLNWLNASTLASTDLAAISINGTHFVVLTDEENSVNFVEYNSYKTGETVEQFCGVNRKALDKINCTYDYNINYKVMQGCTDGVNLYSNVESTQKCAMDRFKCPISTTTYSCSAKGNVKANQSSDLGASGLRRCSVKSSYKCQVKVDGVTSEKTVGRDTALQIVAQGYTCSATGDAMTAIDTNQPDGGILGLVPDSCAAYACTASTADRWVAFSKDVVERDNRQGCLADGVQELDKYTGAGNYKDATFAAIDCKAKYGTYARDGYVRSTYQLKTGLCRSQVANLPAGLTAVDATVNVNRSLTISFNTPKTEDEIRTAFFAKYAKADHVIVSISAAVTPDSFNGDYVTGQCASNADLKKTLLKGTPGNFLDTFKELHGGKKVFWHSVVSRDGKKCDAAQESTPSEGKDYKMLSEMTGGIVQDICDSNFDRFVTDLTKKVVQYVVTKYPIPSDVATKWKERKKLKLKRGDVELQQGIDFEVGEDYIAFRESAGVSDGQLIEMEVTTEEAP